MQGEELKALLVAGLLLASSSAHAAPLHLTCEAIRSESATTNILPAVDQVLIDVEAQTLEMRISSTIGTHQEMTFPYPANNEPFSIRTSPETGDIFGVGIEPKAVYSIELIGDVLRWKFVGRNSLLVEWQCDR